MLEKIKVNSKDSQEEVGTAERGHGTTITSVWGLGHPSLWEWLRTKAINPSVIQGDGLHDAPSVSSRLNEAIIHEANKKSKDKPPGNKNK